MGNAYFKELVGKGDIINELFDIDPDRADLVGYPAIGRKFLLIKSTDKAEEKNNKEESTMNEILIGLTAKILKSEFSAEAVGVFDRLEKSVSEGTATESDVTGLLKELEKALKGDGGISKSEFDVWAEKAATLAPEGEVEPEEEAEAEEEIAEPEEEKAVEKEAEVEAEEEVAAPEEEEAVEEEAEEEVEVEEEEAVGKSLELQIKKQAEDLRIAKQELKKAQGDIETLRIEKQRGDIISKASNELSFLGKSADELGNLLMSLKIAGVPEAVFDSVFGLLKSNSEMIKQSGFFNEFGTSLDDEEDEDPDTALMKRAKELVREEKFDTVEKAYSQLLREDPEILRSE